MVTQTHNNVKLYFSFMPSFAFVFANLAELSTITDNFSHTMYKNTHTYKNMFPSDILNTRNNLQQKNPVRPTSKILLSDAFQSVPMRSKSTSS